MYLATYIFTAIFLLYLLIEAALRKYVRIIWLRKILWMICTSIFFLTGLGIAVSIKVFENEL